MDETIERPSPKMVEAGARVIWGGISGAPILPAGFDADALAEKVYLAMRKLERLEALGFSGHDGVL